MLGIINHSKVPLRLATFAGFIGAAISFLIALVYLILKLAFWSHFELGLAPMLIGVFFIASLQLVFLGVMGEYVGAIYTQVQKRPYAVELERINFDKGFDYPKTGPVQLAHANLYHPGAKLSTLTLVGLTLQPEKDYSRALNARAQRRRSSRTHPSRFPHTETRGSST